MFLRHSHFSTHGDWLACILAVRVETVRFEEHLPIKMKNEDKEEDEELDENEEEEEDDNEVVHCFTPSLC